MGCVWRASKSRLVTKLRSTRGIEKLCNLKPSKNIHNDAAWLKWVKSRTGQSFKERSDQFRDLKKKHIPHNTSRKGMVQLAHELMMVRNQRLLIQAEDQGVNYLDWYSEEEYVIGEEELCSSEATYEIGNISFGHNAADVIVNFATDKEAYVWSPTTTITSIGEAMKAKIAWPFDKLIMDNLDSPTVNKTSGSGHLTSADAKEMVDKIPLGPNSAIVKIQKVFNKDAYLWRPSEEMTVIGDALCKNIAWTISKVIQCNIPATEEAVYKKASDSKETSLSKEAGASLSKEAGASLSKEAEPSEALSAKSVSTSSNNSSSSMKKCFLLDCFGSGKKVAEGRVCSTNPKDTVHFVPLGPKASKV